MTIWDFLIALAVACVPMLAAWVSASVVPWMKERTTAEQRKRLRELVRELVYAAEQMLMTGVIEDRLKYVRKRMAANGVRMPEQEERDLIEEAVLELRIRQGWGLREAEHGEEDKDPEADEGLLTQA